MDYQVKKSGSMDIINLSELLIDFGFKRPSDDAVQELAGRLGVKNGRIEKKKVVEWWAETKNLIKRIEAATTSQVPAACPAGLTWRGVQEHALASPLPPIALPPRTLGV